MVRLQMGKPAFCGRAAAFLTILTTSPIYGQTLKGTILGTITDSTQAVVPDVRVNLTVVLPADAISSVDVSTTNYDPELGRAGGAVVNVIMKSGTNNFHGSLFEYYRDSDLQARNVFATTVPHGVYNQFGGSLGGRIVRDRLFIFGDYQSSRNVDGPTAIPTILTMLMRAGDFSASTTIIFDHNTGSSNGAGRSPFAAFLLDQPNSIGRDQAVTFPTNRHWAYNLYFQDKWQATQKVTMDLGLRWEYWPAGISQVGAYSSA